VRTHVFFEVAGGDRLAAAVNDVFHPAGDLQVAVGAPADQVTAAAKAVRVLFLDNGRLVEDGPVDELLSAGGRFDEFWRQQQERRRVANPCRLEVAVRPRGHGVC